MKRTILSFAVDKGQRKRLLLRRAMQKKIFVILALCVLAVGFALRLVGEFVPSANANARFFLETQFYLSLAYASMLLLSFYVSISLYWVPKASSKMTFEYDDLSGLLMVLSNEKTKKIEINAISLSYSEQLLILQGRWIKILLPLSSISSSDLSILLSLKQMDNNDREA